VILNGLTPAFPVEDGICDDSYPTDVGNYHERVKSPVIPIPHKTENGTNIVCVRIRQARCLKQIEYTTKDDSHEISTINKTSAVENFVILRFPFFIVKEQRILEFSRFIYVEELLSNKLKQVLSLKAEETETGILMVHCDYGSEGSEARS